MFDTLDSSSAVPVGCPSDDAARIVYKCVMTSLLLPFLLYRRGKNMAHPVSEHFQSHSILFNGPSDRAMLCSVLCLNVPFVDVCSYFSAVFAFSLDKDV